jgi:hypothetical protein
MKAAILEKQAFEYLKVKEHIEVPTKTDRDILIKVKVACVNPPLLSAAFISYQVLSWHFDLNSG